VDNPQGRLDYRLTIKDMPAGERPRERLARLGARALSNSELLAIVLRVGVKGETVLSLATRLLSEYGGLHGLAKAGFAELESKRGMGTAKAAQLGAAVELGRRMMLAAPEESVVVRSPADVANLLMAELSHLDQEHFRVIQLDTRNRIVGSQTVYIGSLNASHIRVAEVFREAVKRNCAAIVVAHNHPSGDPAPSSEDISVTRQLLEAGRLLDIELVDHLVIGQLRYVSLRERGLGFD
jgi:DNA repair protein RadC